ncbi:MAG: hypothetical protein CL928_08040 [Deltaproteobacteria bacterium]|nr:hypothetical protein [Deltaproteobacteria bacterium]|tara:strand:- start:959 stop:1492 length:534 start_codon:yes stop_codon:yes gene_type:complete
MLRSSEDLAPPIRRLAVTEETVEESQPQPDDDVVVLVAALSEQAAVDLIEAALPHATHLRPLWERILVGGYDGQMAIGVPITTKVTSDTIENHSRHLYSLLNLLGVPLVTSPMALSTLEIPRSDLRALKGPITNSSRKAAEKAAAKAAEAAAAEAAAAEGGEAEATQEAEATDGKDD